MDNHAEPASIAGAEHPLRNDLIGTEHIYAFVRPSARVARVAALLDMHDSDIRRMVKKGELEAHGKGVRGMRVYLDSVRDFQKRRDRREGDRSDLVTQKPRIKTQVHRAAFQEAMAGLRAKGLA